MPRRDAYLIVLILLIIIPCLAWAYTEYYLPGYYPIVFNQVDYYKVNNSKNFIKTKPYLIQTFGTTHPKKIDFDSQKIIISTKVGDETLHPDYIVSFDKYIESMQAKVFRRTLLLQSLTSSDQASTQTGGLIKDITIDLPNIAIPRSIRRILGNKAGRLNLDGTQRITFSGASTKRKIIPIYERNAGSSFDLKMEQETNLRLSGTIGEKIAVNLKYNSNQDEALFDPNNINIKYTGDEDEVVQSIEAGNIALSLSGSNYISYSTSSQGLFGITSKLKFGALDLTLIASKEEGQKNTKTYVGQSQADSTIIFSRNYALRTFYYLEKPQDIYSLYQNSDNGIPAGWVGNAIKTTAGAWQISNPFLLPKNGTVRVFLDDGDASNNIAAIPGDSVFISQYDYYIPYYDELIEGTDFVTNYEVGTIEVLKAVDRLHTIAVQYVRKDNVSVPSNSAVQDGLLHAKVIRQRNQEYNPSNVFSTWDYQMRNIYSMGISNIKKDDFKLEVFTQNTDNTRNYYIPDSLSTSGFSTYNDYLHLDSNGDGKVNGDDPTVNLSSGYVVIPLLKPFYPLGDTLIYQEESENVSYNDFKHYISVMGKIGRDMISLGQTGVLKGSVKVKVNGATQKENSDYIVDYDMGQITFLTASGKQPDAKIEIDYEYRSGFAVAQKTLAGVRADLNFSESTKLGSTIIYRSETVAEKRPKIGNENMQLFLADIDGRTTWKPGFITKWIDALPLIKTSAESKFTLSGEAAVTIPNISGDEKHKNEAFIDDMEGILDSYPLGVSFSTWVLGSKPWQTTLSKARVNWYNPENIKMKEVYDEATLNDTEKNENVTVLAMKLFPNAIGQPGLSSPSYGGIMKYIGNQMDFSNKKYIELLVKVDSFDDVQPNVTFHIDLGDINEDFYTEYGGLNVLNTEDRDKDGELSLQDPSEDTGLDGIANGLAGDDPNDHIVEKERPDSEGDYPHINGTEGNRVLDTEDLDNNGVLNQLDRYLSYSVSITNTNPNQNPYIVDYITKTKYLLVRIPLNQSSAYEIVNNSSTGILPTLKKISYVRLWAETDKKARVLIASASIVGNKWEDFYIRNTNNIIVPSPYLNANEEAYFSGIADNQKTSHYTSPKNTYYKELNKPTLEQSLTLKAENLQPGHRVLLRQRLIDYYNLLSYNRVLFWVYPENSESHPYNVNDSIDILFRMGADSLNYYQVRQPLKVLDYNTPNNKMQENWWYSLDYELQDFTSIKDSLLAGQELEKAGKFFSYKGNPTLTNVREFVLGIERPLSNSSPYNGITYFNDIRVADPFEDIGWAGRVSLNSVFADVSTLDIEYEQKSENFNPNIQRGRTQNFTFASIKSIKISNKYFLEKFFPMSWNLRLPLSLDRNYSQSIPRFRANSDVRRDEIIDPLDKEREKTENLSYSANMGISQATPSKYALLAYTLSKMSLSGRVSQTIANTATTRDTTLSWQGTYNYNINLPETVLSYPIYKTYKVRLIPSVYTNNFTINSSSPNGYNWEKRDTLRTWFPRAQTYPNKAFTTDNGITWALTSDVSTSFRLQTKRDLLQKNYFQKYNIGKETEYNQDLGASYSPAYFPRIFTLTNSISTRFMENQRKYTSTTTNTQGDIYQKDGNSARTIRANLSLMNSTLLADFATKLNSKQPRPASNDKNAQPEVDIKNKEQAIKDEEYKRHLEESHGKIQEDDLFKELEHKQAIHDSDIEPSQMTEEDLLNKEQSTAEDKVKSLPDSVSVKQPINLPYQFVSLLSRVKNLTATYQNSYTQVYNRQDKRPDFLFQIGLPNQVPMSFLESRANEDAFTLGSGLAVSRTIDTSLNYSYSIAQRFSSASNQTVAMTFPDITLTVAELDKLLGITKFISNTRLNSGYQFSLRQNGDINWEKPKQESKTWSFNPLASVTTNLAKSVQTTVSYNMSKSDNITDMTSYQILRETNSQGLSSNLSYSYKSSTGIELPFTQRKINIKNELTSSLSVSYEKNYDTTQGRESTQVDRNTSRISISPSATYQFDQNIKGGLTSGYEVTRDKKRDDRVRTFRLGIWVEITL
jgi:hypothetical protein